MSVFETTRRNHEWRRRLLINEDGDIKKFRCHKLTTGCHVGSLNNMVNLFSNGCFVIDLCKVRTLAASRGAKTYPSVYRICSNQFILMAQ